MLMLTADVYYMPTEHGKSLTRLRIKQKKYLERKVDLEMTPMILVWSI